MDNKINKNSYSESDIQILEGLEAVRKRPAMYIGSTDGRGLHQLIWEIVDNALDEKMSGFGEKITVTIHKDNSIRVQDNGRGIPPGKHVSGKSTPEVIFTVLHAGGKFDNNGGYKISSGLHGVGASVVNALSSWLELKIYRDGKIYQMRFEHGRVVKDIEVIGNTNKTGTEIWFKPDPKIFTQTEVNHATVSDRLQETAFILKNTEMVLIDERLSTVENYKYEEGILAYVEALCEGKNPMFPPVYFEGSVQGIEIEYAFEYVDDFYGEMLASFVNNIRTKDGGTHETGLKSGITRAFNDYARKYGLLKEKDKNLDGVDIREGLACVLSIRVPENMLQFEGQVKNKFGTAEVKPIIENFIYEKISYFLEENNPQATSLINKAIKARDVREASRKAREDARKVSKSIKVDRGVISKLTPAQSKNSELNELFLVEGDSAGGSAKQGRDRKFQAILSLRGKVLNTEKSDINSLLDNNELKTLIYAIGSDIGSKFDIDQVNFGKVIIMTDADMDGAHIQVLLITFFYRYMRGLIEHGRLYVAMPPLYKVQKSTSKGVKFRYCWDDNELEEAKKEIGPGYSIVRFKGLGEMQSDQLWETTMNPKTRTLMQVTIDDATQAERRITTLMGNKAELRKRWIEQNIQFTLEDDFSVAGGKE